MLNSAQLATFQAIAQSAMDVSIGIYRPALTQDGEGNVNKAFALLATVSGNLAQPTAGQLANYGYAIGDVNAWMVRAPVGTDIRIGDRLIVNGYHLEVQVVLQPQSYQTAMRVLCAELERQ